MILLNGIAMNEKRCFAGFYITIVRVALHVRMCELTGSVVWPITIVRVSSHVLLCICPSFFRI